MNKFSKKYLLLILTLIVSICLTSFLAACQNGVKDEDDEGPGAEGDSNTTLFNPIEATDSTNWSENTDYTVKPVEYSNATILKFAQIYNTPVSDYDLLDRSTLRNRDSALTRAEKDRYDALFDPGESSEYSSFGYYDAYSEEANSAQNSFGPKPMPNEVDVYDSSNQELSICIMVFKFRTDYRKTQEDMTAAQNFYDSLAENPVTANGEELNLSFKYENSVFVGNEKGFGYLHQDYVDASSRLTADEEWAKSLYDLIGSISKAGVAEAKINAVLDTIKTVNQANNEIKPRAQSFVDETDREIEGFRNVVDSIIANISIDQIGLFGYNYIMLMHQNNIDYLDLKIEQLNSDSEYLEYYEEKKNEAIKAKETIESIPQSQFLVFSRILISMLKSGIQLINMDETKELYSLFLEGDLLLKDAAKTLAKEIDALNIGQETMSLLLSTLADMRIADYCLTGEVDNITMYEATEDEQQQEHNKYSKACDNGVHNALYAIKDDFSAILSIISKACNSINNTDMTNYTKKSGIYTILDGSVSFSIGYEKYYVNNQEVTEEEYYQAREKATIYYVDRQQVTREIYNQTIIENDKYTIKLLVSGLSDLTDADYELLFTNFSAAATAMNDAFVEQGFEADEYEGTVPTQQELITAMKTIAAMTDEDIQNIESSEDSENVYSVLKDLNAYFKSKMMNVQ